MPVLKIDETGNFSSRLLTLSSYRRDVSAEVQEPCGFRDTPDWGPKIAESFQALQAGKQVRIMGPDWMVEVFANV